MRRKISSKGIIPFLWLWIFMATPLVQGWVSPTWSRASTQMVETTKRIIQHHLVQNQPQPHQSYQRQSPAFPYLCTRLYQSTTSSGSSSSSGRSRYVVDDNDNDDDGEGRTSPASPVDERYFSVPPTQPQLLINTKPRITLTRFLGNIVKEDTEARDMESLLLAIQMACKTISSLVNRAGLANSEFGDYSNSNSNSNNYSDGRFYSMKRLDLLSTIVLKNALQFTGKCECVAPGPKVDTESPAEHQPGVLIASALDSNYVTVLDPLDGSGNADASICTATVFGVFEQPKNDKTDSGSSSIGSSSSAGMTDEAERNERLVQSVLQPAKNMRAAGYCLYSSATVLVFTLAEGGVYGFTLDQQLQEFVLTHRDLTIPKRGNVYSCNEANSEGWDDDWKTYVRNLKLGQGETKKPYALRYVGSMVGDIHRTLLYGGIFAYPSDSLRHPDGNLQLLYKTAPMAFVVHRAGGKVIDGRTGNLLEVTPERVHQKSPCFIGSPEDVEEFEKYLNKKV